MEVRQARITDVPGIAALVDRFAGRGLILPRPTEEIYQSLREWMVAEQAGQIIGCGALVILWADLAEIRSLVVVPEVQRTGVGRGLVTALMNEAAELKLPQVFALTRKSGFFLKLGFRVVPRESLPRKIWKDCITCTKFMGCDEVAVVRQVDGVRGPEDWKHGSLASANHKHMTGTPYPTIQPPDWDSQPSNLPSFQPPSLPSAKGDDNERSFPH